MVKKTIDDEINVDGFPDDFGSVFVVYNFIVRSGKFIVGSSILKVIVGIKAIDKEFRNVFTNNRFRNFISFLQ